MERLTKYAIPKAGRGIPAKLPCFSTRIVKNDCPTFFCYKVKKCEHIKNRECPYLRVMDKLAAYEDAMPLERAKELAQAEKDGRLVVLPVKIGDIIYRLFDGEIQNLLVSNVIYRAIGGDACRIIVECIPFHRCYWREDFGKTVFPTREEAEAALGKREGT